jgi:glycosyltransferase involved in cell wall biosynthesis
LRDLAGKFRIREHLLISPDLDNAAKLTALESADVYIQPSHEEGFCLAYAEAAAIVPRLVGTDAGAIAAMSRADAGARIVPIKDPSALGAAVVELLTTDLPMNLMNLRSQRLSREFSLERYLADHEKLYAGPGSRS